MKKCGCCKENKDLSKFSKNKGTCKSCISIKGREYRYRKSLLENKNYIPRDDEYKNRTTKKCNICNIEKELSEFSYTHGKCKKCYLKYRNELNREYTTYDLDIIKSIDRTCKECNNEKKLTDFVKDKRMEYGYKYICKNCINIKYKKYNTEENRIKHNESQREKYKNDPNVKLEKNKRLKERYDNDISYKICQNIRVSIRNSIRNGGYDKKSKSFKILGCSYEEFKIYLESKFKDWMTWDNKGLYNGEFNYGWDLDHIIPISSVKTEEDIIKLNHYTNFQPLCSHINRDIKKDRLDYN